MFIFFYIFLVFSEMPNYVTCSCIHGDFTNSQSRGKKWSCETCEWLHFSHSEGRPLRN